MRSDIFSVQVRSARRDEEVDGSNLNDLLFFVKVFSWKVNFSNLIFAGTLGKIFLLVVVDPFLKLTNRNNKNN